MANKKISELTSSAPLTGAELLPLVQGGETLKTTAQDIADLGGGGGLFEEGTGGATSTQRVGSGTASGGKTLQVDITQQQVVESTTQQVECIQP